MVVSDILRIILGLFMVVLMIGGFVFMAYWVLVTIVGLILAIVGYDPTKPDEVDYMAYDAQREADALREIDGKFEEAEDFVNDIFDQARREVGDL